MMPKELINELRRIVGDRHVSESRTAAELYSYDGSLAKGAPGAVVFPADSPRDRAGGASRRPGPACPSCPAASGPTFPAERSCPTAG